MIKSENYLVVQGWMISELGLSGNELMCYALIYGFSQDGESVFQGNSKYISEWLNISQRSVFPLLKKLTEKGLIEKIEKTINGVRLCDYKVASEVLKNLQGGMKKLHRGTEETSVGGTEETSYHNNNIDNYKDIYNNNNIYNKPEKRFKKPTIDEIKTYCLERKNTINAEQFFDFYESKGWKIGNSPMKDWKASVRTWEKKERERRTWQAARGLFGVESGTYGKDIPL